MHRWYWLVFDVSVFIVLLLTVIDVMQGYGVLIFSLTNESKILFYFYDGQDKCPNAVTI